MSARRTIGRRAVLAAVSVMPLALGACAPDPTTGQMVFSAPTVGAIATDVSIVATGMGSVLAQMKTMTIPGLTSGMIDTVGTYVAGIQSLAAAIASAPSGAAPVTVQDKIKQIETYLNATVTTLAAIPLIPPPISTYLVAAAILLPIIEAAAGLVVGVIAPPPPSPVPVTTPDQARAVLSS